MVDVGHWTRDSESWENAAEIDDRMVRELLKVIEESPELNWLGQEFLMSARRAARRPHEAIIASLR